MKEYVLGFCFTPGGEAVALIKKTKPEWQKGRLNGIGGKIEENETPAEAMQREFMEETGVVIKKDNWNKLGVFKSPNWIVHVFYQFTDKVVDIKTTTEEEVILADVKYVMSRNEILPNLRWLLPLCLDKEVMNVEVEYSVTAP
jgi:8-oxo-dGTP diphosphatase